MSGMDENNNFLYLTASLLLLSVVSPLADLLPVGLAYWILKIIMVGTIVVCYLSLKFGPVWRIFITLSLVLMIASSVMGEQFQWGFSSLADLFIMLIFFIGAAYSAATRVLLKGDVNINKIVGAFAVYLLLGMIWAMLYLIVLDFSPTAFNGIEYLNWEDSFTDATYLSYVTLTTLGYGDITPAEPISRVLVYLEAIVGVFYMAVVIASLIGSRSGRRGINN